MVVGNIYISYHPIFNLNLSYIITVVSVGIFMLICSFIDHCIIGSNHIIVIV